MMVSAGFAIGLSIFLSLITALIIGGAWLVSGQQNRMGRVAYDFSGSPHEKPDLYRIKKQGNEGFYPYAGEGKVSIRRALGPFKAITKKVDKDDILWVDQKTLIIGWTNLLDAQGVRAERVEKQLSEMHLQLVMLEQEIVDGKKTQSEITKMLAGMIAETTEALNNYQRPIKTGGTGGPKR